MKFDSSIYEFETLCLDKFGFITEQNKGKAKQIIFKLSQRTKLEMTQIPSGEFLMGSSTDEIEFRENETPQHKVKVPKFYLGKYPVTQTQWLAVMDELPKISKEFRGGDLPVVNVWIEKALEFCSKLSKLTGESFRLPSEAEWEYACRAGTKTAFNFGDLITTDLANYDGTRPFLNTPQGKFRNALTPVGHFKFANNFGLFDMHGNVWEWCADVWHPDYKHAPTDGSVWAKNGDQSYAVQRGGSWKSRAGNCRSAFRAGDIAHSSAHIVGLRVCMTAN
jgi:formylglycine-generating enzyme required for sulfatase activity